MLAVKTPTQYGNGETNHSLCGTCTYTVHSALVLKYMTTNHTYSTHVCTLSLYHSTCRRNTSSQMVVVKQSSTVNTRIRVIIKTSRGSNQGGYNLSCLYRVLFIRKCQRVCCPRLFWVTRLKLKWVGEEKNLKNISLHHTTSPFYYVP